MSSSTTRRGFLHTSLAAGAMIAGGALPAMMTRHAAAFQENSKAGKPLKILILGGTQFIGPALVELARKRGHSITVFNRGITEKRKGHLGDDIERLVGDRDPSKGEGIKALQDKKWDVCIDDSGYFPRHVKVVAELLAPNVKQYIFVSTISVYADNSKAGQDEDAPLAPLAVDDPEDMAKGQNYGGLKVLCEQAAEKALPGRTTIVRPGFIVGPGDPTDRFTYWPWRVQHSGQTPPDDYGTEMLAPGTKDDPIQVIDVRDLAAFLLRVAEDNTIGTFNACGPSPSPEKPLTMGQLLSESQRACAGGPAGKTELTWVSAKFIRDYNAEQAKLERPDPINTTIWIPPEGESAGFHQWSNARAVKAGMTFRPIFDTIHDTLEWFPKEIERRVRVTAEIVDEAKAKGEPAPDVGQPGKIRAGIPPELERRVLEAWRQQQPAG
jgi:2'-hydroxyisoflavone reductase